MALTALCLHVYRAFLGVALIEIILTPMQSFVLQHFMQLVLTPLGIVRTAGRRWCVSTYRGSGSRSYCQLYRSMYSWWTTTVRGIVSSSKIDVEWRLPQVDAVISKSRRLDAEVLLSERLRTLVDAHQPPRY